VELTAEIGGQNLQSLRIGGLADQSAEAFPKIRREVRFIDPREILAGEGNAFDYVSLIDVGFFGVAQEGLAG
jgi:hypothetical protein